ncbi:kinesin-domain-containing protein, partial [Martensiomyces pterosporus]
ADRAFTFDYVFSPEVSQEQIYDDSIQPLVKQFLQGYNATVLAYGQTGSGKTFSMGTGLSTSVVLPEMQGDRVGIVPRAIHAVWSHLDRKAKKNIGFTYSIEISFLELYNEDLIDLLNPRSVVGGSSGRGPSIREDSRGNMVLVGVERRPVTCEDDIIGYLHQGTLSRTTASTDMNRTSSRSHAIFTLFLRQQNRRSSAALATNGSLQGLEHGEPDGSPSIVSKIHFVDLAGSERMKRTGAAGNRVKEGISINAGLLALGNVISALGNASANGQQGKRPAHVPYRDSKLTRLLQDSLGGNSQTLMLACISPSEKNSSESLNTIRYANRARNIRNKVAVN